MTDVDEGIINRMQSYQSSGGGPSWLPADMLGSKFKFEKDRTLGRKRLHDMVKTQVEYLMFLMSALPVPDDDATIKAVDVKQGNFAGKQMAVSWSYEISPLMQCQNNSENYVKCYNRKLDAIKWFYDVNRVPNKNKGTGKTFGQIPLSPSSAKTIEQIVDEIIDKRLLDAELNLREDFFKKTVNQTGVKPNTQGSFLCFPMGNEVPLRMKPLELKEIRSKYEDPIILRNNNFNNPFNKDGVLNIGYPSFTVLNFAPLPSAPFHDALGYTAISDFPIECFGYKTSPLGAVHNDAIYLNDLMNDYFHYLSNTSLSFDEFEFPIPEEPPVGESGNVIPPKCFDGSCDPWDAEGFLTFEDWVDFIELNQQKNISQEDLALVNTIDIDEDIETLFEGRYIDYGDNPEFMPTYKQIPQWRFSNACQDKIEYQLIDMNGTKLYFTNDSYNYIVSLMAITRFNSFLNELKETHTFNYVDQFGGYNPIIVPLFKNQTKEDMRVSGNFSKYIEHIGELTDSEKRWEKSSEAYVVVQGITIQNRFNIIKKGIEKYYLLPEGFVQDGKVHEVPYKDVIAYIKSIAHVYDLSLEEVAKFNLAENQSIEPFKNCMKLLRNFEGIAFTKTQRTAYRNTLEKIFSVDWDSKAKAIYAAEVGAFNAQKNEIEWVQNHPIEAWMRDNIYKKVIIPVMDFCVTGSPVVDTIISIAFGMFVTDNPIGLALLGLSLTMANTAWETSAPEGSAFHNVPALTPEEIGKAFGVAIITTAATEAFGAVASRYGPTLVRMSAQGMGAAAARISRLTGSIFEDAELVLQRMGKTKASWLKYLAQDVDGGVLKTLAKIQTLDAEILSKNAAHNLEIAELNSKYVDAIFKGAGSEEEIAALEKTIFNKAAENDLINGEFNEALLDLEKKMTELAKKAGLPKEVANSISSLKAAQNAYKETKALEDAAREALAQIPPSGKAGGSEAWQKAFADLKKAELASKDSHELMDAAAWAGSFMASHAGDLPGYKIWNLQFTHFMKIFVEQVAEAPGSILQHYINTGIIAVIGDFGIKDVAQGNITITALLAHYFTTRDTAFLPPPKAGEDYPVLAVEHPSPKLEIEMLRLNQNYFFPLRDAWILWECTKEELETHLSENNNKARNNENDCKSGKERCDPIGQSGGFDCKPACMTHLLEETNKKRESVKSAEENKNKMLERYLKYFYYLLKKYGDAPLTDDEIAKNAALYKDELIPLPELNPETKPPE